jgi:hypothetical protein
MLFLGFSNHEKRAPRSNPPVPLSSWSLRQTVCSTFSRSGWSVVRSASLAKAGTSKKWPPPRLHKVPTRSNKASPKTFKTALECWSNWGITGKELMHLTHVSNWRRDCTYARLFESTDTSHQWTHTGTRHTRTKYRPTVFWLVYVMHLSFLLHKELLLLRVWNVPPLKSRPQNWLSLLRFFMIFVTASRQILWWYHKKNGPHLVLFLTPLCRISFERFIIIQLDQEFPTFMKPEVNKNPPLGPNLNHLNTLHSLSPYFLHCYPSSYSQVSISVPFEFWDKSICVYHVTHACCMPRSSHPPCFNHFHAKNYFKLFVCSKTNL